MPAAEIAPVEVASRLRARMAAFEPLFETDVGWAVATAKIFPRAVAIVAMMLEAQSLAETPGGGKASAAMFEMAARKSRECAKMIDLWQCPPAGQS